MQDNTHHTYSKEFIDNKWAAMSSKLDTALPVKSEKSNDKLIWLLSLLLLVATVAASYYGYMYKHLIPAAALTKEKVIYKNVYLTEAANEAIQKEVIFSTEPKQSIKIDKEETIIQQEVTALIQSIPAEDQTELTTESDQFPSTVELAPLKDLESIANNNISIETSIQDLGLTTDTNLDLPAKRSVRISAGLAVLATHDGDFTGYGIASSFDIPLTKRLGINTGVAHNSFSKDHYFVNGIPRTEEVFNLPQAPRPRNAPIVYDDELRSLKQVYVPLGLNYSFTEAFSLNSGVRVRYTYGTELDEQPRNPAESTFFNNTNLGFSAGLQYNLTNHFSILLDSEWGMGALRSSQINDSSSPNHDLNLVNLRTNLRF